MPKLTISREDEEECELYYKITGNGPSKVLLISGLGAIVSQWDYQVEYFKNFPEFSVLTFDNRGSGYSSATTPPYTTTSMTKDINRLLDLIGWRDFKLHVVGMSMGGMIAQEMACSFGDRVKTLALISTYSKFNGLPTNPLNIIGVVKTLASPPLTTATPAAYSESTLKYNFPKNWLDEKSTEKGKEHLTNYEAVLKFQTDRFTETGLQDPLGRAGQRNACLTHYVDTRLTDLSKFSYPKLVITGDNDHLMRQPISSLYLAKQLKAELVIYPNGGHNLRIQDPKWLNETLLHHFRRADGSSLSSDEVKSHLKNLSRTFSAASLDSFATAEEMDGETQMSDAYFAA